MVITRAIQFCSHWPTTDWLMVIWLYKNKCIPIQSMTMSSITDCPDHFLLMFWRNALKVCVKIHFCCPEVSAGVAVRASFQSIHSQRFPLHRHHRCRRHRHRRHFKWFLLKFSVLHPKDKGISPGEFDGCSKGGMVQRPEHRDPHQTLAPIVLRTSDNREICLNSAWNSMESFKSPSNYCHMCCSLILSLNQNSSRRICSKIAKTTHLHQTNYQHTFLLTISYDYGATYTS